jgi:hypothetical protein
VDPLTALSQPVMAHTLIKTALYIEYKIVIMQLSQMMYESCDAVMCICAGVLEASLLKRLRGTPTGNSAGSSDPMAKSLLTDAPAMYGCCTGKGSHLQLLWLDEVVATEGEAGSWHISYKACRAQVEGERDEEAQYEAVVLPDSNAPEGFVVSVGTCAA